MNTIFLIILIGIGATAIMDIWSLIRQLLFSVPAPNYAMVGRWVAYMKDGQFKHDSIAASKAKTGEKALGWLVHYLTGIAYALLLVVFYGQTWLTLPQLIPALLIGLVTVAAPFFIMQPGMGAGIASSKTAHPNIARLHSVINHGIFGIGLYWTAYLIQ